VLDETDTPGGNVNLIANTNNGAFNTSALANGSGNFDLGLFSGTWTVSLDSNDVAALFLVPQALSLNMVDGVDQNGLIFRVHRTLSTSTISGSVLNTSGAPLTFANVTGSATINGITYSTGAQTDNTGHYSFPVIDGTWTVSVPQPGVTSQIVNVTGSAIVNFVQSVITHQPQNQSVTAGQGTSFNVGTNTPGPNTLQWQRLPAGSGTWVDLMNDTTYSGVTNNGLGVANTTVAMNGDQFRCVVRYMVGATPMMTTSSAATLSVISQFQAWQNSNFTPAQLGDPTVSGPLATPAGDGISNLMKYALNLQPFTNCTTLIPHPTRGANTLTMSFQATHSDVTYVVQVSSGLQSWTTTGVMINTVGQTITATYDTTGQPQSFMRLMVTMP